MKFCSITVHILTQLCRDDHKLGDLYPVVRTATDHVRRDCGPQQLSPPSDSISNLKADKYSQKANKF